MDPVFQYILPIIFTLQHNLGGLIDTLELNIMANHL